MIVTIHMEEKTANALFMHLMDGDKLDELLRIEAFGAIAQGRYDSQEALGTVNV